MGCFPETAEELCWVKAGAVKNAAQNKDAKKVMSSEGVREHPPEVLPLILPLFTISLASLRQERLSNISHS